jgi:4-hydroxybutyrate CoA-transferase
VSITPVRRGRLSGKTDWRKQYEALKLSAEDAAALIRNGDALAMTGASNWASAFDRALADQLKKTGDHVEIDTMFVLQPYALLEPELLKQAYFQSDFFSVGERKYAPMGNMAYVPANLSETGRWMYSRRPRVAVISCSAPDENGWMSRSLWGAHLHRSVLEACDLLLVEVNDQLPAIPSEGEGHMLVHVSEVDGIIENSHPPLASPAAETDELDRKIAGYIADLVPDGSCVQFGLGGLANAIGSNLAYAGKKDLGIQSEVISSCVVDLMKKGVINNSRKQTFPGRAVGTYFIGDEELWKFAGNNPLFTHKEIDWTNDSRRIAQNDNVVSINNAMEVDLTGQVNAESIGARQFSGTGGQLEWVIGSQWSKGGKSIIALRSTYTDRSGTLHSKIHAELPLGSIVTTPRTWVQYVVTEYGVADLKYKTTHDRAKALINIAHPDFREELRRKMPL